MSTMNSFFQSSMTEMRDYFDDGTNDTNNNVETKNEDNYDNYQNSNEVKINNNNNNDDNNYYYNNKNRYYSNNQYYRNNDNFSYRNRNYNRNSMQSWHKSSNTFYDNNNNNNRSSKYQKSKPAYRLKHENNDNNDINNKFTHHINHSNDDFDNTYFNKTQIQQSNQNFAEQNEDNYNNQNNKIHRYESSNLSDRAKEMIDQILNGEYDCMVCHSTVGKKGKIWTCKHCHTIFHLTCINRWAFAREKKEAEQENRPPKDQSLIKSIRCPACNFVDNEFKMNKYYCYCGKQCLDDVLNSDYHNTNGIPHSCGEMCEHYRGATLECQHKCMAQCHPGPCDPCRLPSSKIYKCECGKMQYNLRCGQQELEPRLCSLTCEKLLNCKNHSCNLQCHHGPCPKCPIKIFAVCFCGKEKKELSCGEGKEIELENGKKEVRFKCNNICNKLLSCGNHYCVSECHSGSCSNCPRKVVNPPVCACGKTTFSNNNNNKLIIRKSCLDPLPTCSQKCDRMLSCGIHFCKQKCHDSKCPSCNIPIKKVCRCKAETKTLKCSEYNMKLQQINNGVVGVDIDMELITNPDSFVRCKRVCKKILNCGYHTCKVVCCAGRNVFGYEGHVCHEKCLRPLSCGRHYCNNNCHAGSCPPCGVTYRNGISCACGEQSIPGPIQCSAAGSIKCERKCNKLLPCGHECAMKCHYGDCDPNCHILVDKLCNTHQNIVHNIPCHVKSVSCGQECNLLLPCQQHLCPRTCHSGECVSNDEYNHIINKGCSNICNKLLRCGHSCLAKCHPNVAICNSQLCQVKINVKCLCGNRSEQQYCNGRTEFEIKAILCDERCTIEERNKHFRDAFNIDNNNNNNNNKTENNIPFATNTLEKPLKNLLEAYPHQHMVVIDSSNISSSTIRDRLLAWTGDYKIWRNEPHILYIVFSNEELRNSAFASVLSKFNGRKATNNDSLLFSKFISAKKQQQNQNHQNQKDNNNNNNKQKGKNKKKEHDVTKDGWHISNKNNNQVPIIQNNNNNDNNTSDLNNINFASHFN